MQTQPTRRKLRLLRRSTGTIALLLILAAAAVPAAAQGSRAAAPEKQFSRYKLKNGLEVAVVENHLVPIVTIELAVRNGSFTEGPDYAGLSHLYEHMFFKGNSRYKSSEEFISMLGSIGALYNATTREEVVTYYYTLPADNLSRGLEVMAQTVQTPLFDTLELEREREVVLGEFDRQESNPFFPFVRATSAALWGDYITRKEPIGQRPVIKTATPEKMRTIQHRYYIPNNSLLIVAGDVDTAQVFEMARRYFSTWEPGPDPFKDNPVPRPQPLTEKKLVMVPADADLAQVQFQFHGPSIGVDNEATYAADVFIFILSQQQSRFQRKLVESGLAQAAAINYYTQRYTGPIAVNAVTTPDKIRPALNALWAEMQDFDSPDYFTDEELETAKAILRVQHLYDSEETSDWTHTLAFWWSTTGLDYFRGYLDNLSKVKREDIQRYVRQYIKGKNYVLGISSNQESLSTLNLKPAEVLR
jgi:zinc protease